MVDPNPARGMPIQLQRYWLAGKGAAKIRWNVPGDFMRCVRALRSKFPQNPEGLCNILHTKATGGPPGHGSAEHSLIASLGVHLEHPLTLEMEPPEALVAAAALLAAQPVLGEKLWAGPLAPISRPTGEPGGMRIFEPGSIKGRALPLPLRHRRMDLPGHQGAVTVARILGYTTGPDEKGRDWVYGWGDWLDETIIPEVKEARYLVDQGVTGTSLDPGGRVRATVNPETGAHHTTEYTFGGATLVAIPAFSDMRIYNLKDGDWPDDDPDMDIDYGGDGDDCGCGSVLPENGSNAKGMPSSYAVNSSGWRGLPLAPREAAFDNDDAVKRITAWAHAEGQGPDVAKFKKAFMYFDSTKSPTDPTSYRLPVGDIVNGRLTLVFHAIYAAAALLSGAHGGLPDIPDEEKGQLRAVISEIYPELAKAFNDSSIAAPWDRPASVQAREDAGIQGKEFAMSDTTYPLKPPREWFEDPELSEKTPVTVTPEGQVYGHLAAWDECHRDVSQRSCVLAPKSRKGYAPFHLGHVFVANGDRLAVGKIVMDTRHADINLGYSAAAIHYDHTGDEVAIVRAGEDEFGIWVAGSMVPDSTPAKAAKLRRSPLSGDWRAVEGHLELTAALAVNVPAFPVYAMEGEEQMALVAAGQVFPDGIELSEEEDVVVDEAADDRAWEFRIILDEDDQIQQWERARKLAALYVADGEPAPEVPAEDPVYGMAGMLARQMDAQYTIVGDDEEAGPGGSQPEPQPNTGTPVVPVGATPPAGA